MDCSPWGPDPPAYAFGMERLMPHKTSDLDHVSQWFNTQTHIEETRSALIDQYSTREHVGEFTKRVLDIVISLCLLLLASPVMFGVGLMIKLDNGGPVFYRQERTGLHGKRFVLLKFRSMVLDAEAASGPCWAQPLDPRITRVGRIIRPMRLDEFPQLLNVLCGDM